MLSNEQKEAFGTICAHMVITLLQRAHYEIKQNLEGITLMDMAFSGNVRLLKQLFFRK